MPSAAAVNLQTSIGPLADDEIESLGQANLLRNAQHFGPYSTRDTELFWVRVEQDGQFAAAVPVVRLRKRRATDMLRDPVRRWLGPVLGPVAKKTTLLVDTAFLAYDDRSPFRRVGDVDPLPIKLAVSAFLRAQRGVDTVWISEPADSAGWARQTDHPAAKGYQQFYTLPMVHVATAGHETLAQYVASLSKKRRRNFRHERAQFEQAGGRFETHRGPLSQPLLDELLRCLRASAAHSQFVVPYNDVLTAPAAFAAQRQTVIAARVDGSVVGFMSLIDDGQRLYQCHGGLDYGRSHEVYAYHNLIYRAIEVAIEGRLSVLSMGPLNNETKRRAATDLKPIVASLWNRNPGDRLAARVFFAKNFEVYRGEVNGET